MGALVPMAKRSKAALTRLVEDAVAEVCGLPRPGLWFCVSDIETHGCPPHRLSVAARLHFLPEGSPFCCGEPGCHLGLRGDRLRDVGDRLRQAMGLRQSVEVEFVGGVRPEYHPDVEFKVHG